MSDTAAKDMLRELGCNWRISGKRCASVEDLAEIGEGLYYCPAHLKKVLALREWVIGWRGQHANPA